MLNLIIGASAGFIGGFLLKGQSSKAENSSPSGVSYSTLYNDAQVEISKLKSELANRTSEIEDLNTRLKIQNKKLPDYEDKAEDKSDDLMDMRKMIDSLHRQNDELSEKLSDYKALYIEATQEIERLKK